MKLICLIAALVVSGVCMGTDSPAASYVPHALIQGSHTSSRVEIGTPAPGFQLDGVVHSEFKTFSLEAYRGKWVVLFFYPGDFTFICPTEIKGFNRALAEFDANNTQVLAISVDSKYSHLAWIKSGALGKVDFPLLSDFSKHTSRAYGVLDETSGAARRGLFIIDPQGVTQYQVVHSDKVGRSVEETVRVLKALQTEELCPLDWKPGEKTIKK
ncbi:MAG: peroxiredoxin [Desulfuromonadales bacterium]|nr:peroxiredoxin [Desulfuromonadales bacterium]